ncbi:MAG: Hpt domain-containing protein, partial [Ignavibacteria bacterium]|nr:Hpt domain-containing protein [Ignavibacteria bacterium]
MPILNQNPMLIDPDMKEIVESFIIETKEILEKLDVDLVEMEKRPDDNELLNSVFRHFHTIKGTSSFLGLDKLTRVTHKGEDILNKLRKGEAKLNSIIMDSLLAAYDKIKSILYSIQEFQNEDVEVEDTIKDLTNLILSLENSGAAAEKKKPVKKSRKKNIKVEETIELIKEKVKAEANNVEVMEENVEEEAPQAECKQISEVKVKHDPAKKVDNSIRVDVERLDELLNIVSELVLGRNRLAQVNSEFALENEGTKFSRDLSDATKQINL